MVDGIAAGQPAPNDLSLAWVREDVLKAQGNKEYVPFTVSVDASKVTGNTVAFYWRVVNKNAPPAADAKKDDKKDEKKDEKMADKAGTIEVYKGKDGFRFRVKGPDGKTLAISARASSTKEDALKVIDELKETLASAKPTDASK